jgi:holo-[acyl-carrier protein] synthase
MRTRQFHLKRDDEEAQLRLGIDVQSVREVESSLFHFGSRYLKCVFDPNECSYANSHPLLAARYLAGRFAARESVLKLLEISDVVASWHDIHLTDHLASPKVDLSREPMRVASNWGVSRILISVAYERDIAIAISAADIIQ